MALVNVTCTGSSTSRLRVQSHFSLYQVTWKGKPESGKYLINDKELSGRVNTKLSKVGRFRGRQPC